MRHSVIIGTIAVSLVLVAGAQASDWSREHGQREAERHAYRGDHDDRYERGRSHHDDRRFVTCAAEPAAWLSAGDLRAKLASAGYQVWSFEPKRNGCIEANVTQANGWSNKLYVDPATAEIKYRKR